MDACLGGHPIEAGRVGGTLTGMLVTPRDVP